MTGHAADDQTTWTEYDPSCGCPPRADMGYRRTIRRYRNWHRVFKERRAKYGALEVVGARGRTGSSGGGNRTRVAGVKGQRPSIGRPRKTHFPRAGVLTLRIDWPRWPRARVGSEGIEPSPRRLRAGCASATLRARRVGREGLEPSSLRLKAGCLAHWASVPREGRGRALRSDAPSENYASEDRYLETTFE